MGNYLRPWDTIFGLERIQYSALYVSPEKPFGRYCNQYLLNSPYFGNMAANCR